MPTLSREIQWSVHIRNISNKISTVTKCMWAGRKQVQICFLPHVKSALRLWGLGTQSCSVLSNSLALSFPQWLRHLSRGNLVPILTRHGDHPSCGSQQASKLLCTHGESPNKTFPKNCLPCFPRDTPPDLRVECSDVP